MAQLHANHDDPPPYKTNDTNAEGCDRAKPGPPPCTCPRRAPDGTQTNADNQHNQSGIDGAKIAKIAGGALLVGVAAPVLAVAGAAVVLPAIGFTSAGVAGGSLAAMAQSVFYGASTGGLFSVLQSAGATIVAPAAMEVIGAATLATAGATSIAGGIGKGSDEDNGRGEDEAEHEQADDDHEQVACACAHCVCEDSCNCACRRRRRRGGESS